MSDRLLQDDAGGWRDRAGFGQAAADRREQVGRDGEEENAHRRRVAEERRQFGVAARVGGVHRNVADARAEPG